MTVALSGSMSPTSLIGHGEKATALSDVPKIVDHRLVVPEQHSERRLPELQQQGRLFVVCHRLILGLRQLPVGRQLTLDSAR